jgi:hypothetical protein
MDNNRSAVGCKCFCICNSVLVEYFWNIGGVDRQGLAAFDNFDRLVPEPNEFSKAGHDRSDHLDGVIIAATLRKDEVVRYRRDPIKFGEPPLEQLPLPSCRTPSSEHVFLPCILESDIGLHYRFIMLGRALAHDPIYDGGVERLAQRFHFSGVFNPCH